MTQKAFKIAKIAITIFVAITVITAVAQANIFLALAGVVIGMLFVWMLRKRTKGVLIDERMQAMSEKAGRTAYLITANVLGWTSVVLMLVDRQDNFIYLDLLALIFSYTTLFIIAVYAISYRYYMYKAGGHDKE